MLTAGWEARVLDLLYMDYQPLDSLVANLRCSERGLIYTLESLRRRELLKAYRFDPTTDPPYIELGSEDAIPEPLSLSIFFHATDAGRKQFDAYAKKEWRWVV